MEKIKPYNSDKSKQEEVRSMFDKISGKYDILNRVLSLGIDQSWRRKTLKMIDNPESAYMLDLATGTSDIAIMAAEKFNVSKIVGLDLSDKMLEVAGRKIRKKNLENEIKLIQGKSEDLPFEDNSFDVITVGFGVRNYDNLEKGLSEMYRVLKPGGQCLILEFSHPRSFPFRNLYHFYFKNVLPLIGKLSSKDNRAYSYLFESSMKFPAFENFVSILDKLNYKETSYKELTLGICCIYSARK